jgi:hypothetical protein
VLSSLEPGVVHQEVVVVLDDSRYHAVVLVLDPVDHQSGNHPSLGDVDRYQITDCHCLAKGRSIIIDMSGNWVHISLGTSARGYFILDFLMTRVSRFALLVLVVYAKSTWVSVVTEPAKTMPMSAQSSSITILMFI